MRRAAAGLDPGSLFGRIVGVALATWLASSNLAAAAGPAGPFGATAVADDPLVAAPVFGDTFWKQWGDGQAELAGYDLTIDRYGEARKGIAVAIFVTETFSNSLRVKSDPGQHPAADEFPVMKLNLVQDFSTGIYDYNLLTSAFSALASVNGLPAGALTKVSFSAQEWCGHVYAQALVGPDSLRIVSHSYFDGEADGAARLPVPVGGLCEDALLLWARGFAGPVVAAGQETSVPIFDSLRLARLAHRAPRVQRVRLAVGAAARSLTVPAGTFNVSRCTAVLETPPRTWAIDVETAPPHRIIRWSRTQPDASGEKNVETAELLAAERLKYWQMNGPGYETELKKLGLTPRPPRTP